MRKIALALGVAAALAASPALAQTSTSPRAAGPTGTWAGATMDNNISIFGLLGYGYYSQTGYGLGVRYQKEIVPDGLLKLQNIHDEIGIEGGLDWTRYSFGGGVFLGNSYDWTVNTFTPVIGAVWNFWFTPQFAAYPKLDLGYRFARVSFPEGFTNSTGYSEFFIQGAVGAVYKLSSLALRAELGSSTLRLGVGFNF